MTPEHTKLLAQLALACVLGYAVLWWFSVGARRWTRRRSLRQGIAALGGGADGPFVGAAPLQEAFAQARQSMQPPHLQLRPRRDALYRMPWILFLGDTHSRVHALLHAGAPAAPEGSVRTQFWRWWLMPKVVAIECDPALVEDGVGREVLAGWYHALLALADKRGAQPLDGLALCVDAGDLLADAAAAQQLAQRLRERADEASQQLRLRLLAQVVVTGLDRLPGYAVACQALPAAVLAQAVGFRVPVGTATVIDEVLDELSGRWRALRMTLLRAQHDAAGRLAIHAFFEALLALQPGLSAFLKVLFPPSSAPYRLRARGLYFVAAPAQPTAQIPAAFVADLFARFLPHERAFVRPRR